MILFLLWLFLDSLLAVIQLHNVFKSSLKLEWNFSLCFMLYQCHRQTNLFASTRFDQKYCLFRLENVWTEDIEVF